ncbi:cation transporter [Geobacter sp. AOG2]|uniref:cation transporter n=1 Tax=Geobacter sp. AOG2 TaxID=1566347 RepID=UPI001CC4BE7D|nr:cation transporter [Geobacter sp. AOG2]GFE60165.1 membrane protein [Geobacter sp. AOG2]
MSALEQRNLYARANFLAVFTIVYNFIEGVVSLWLGAADETLALFGFGLDSFIEVVSAVGVWHMVKRIRANNGETRDEFEQRALRITGVSFYVLASGLLLSAVVNIGRQHKPQTTMWGIVVSAVSISFMWALIHHKVKVGRALNSAAILADAACSRACVYLSLVLLVASLGYELTGIGSLDAAGAMLIAWLSWREGSEAFRKAKGIACCCCAGECGE